MMACGYCLELSDFRVASKVDKHRGHLLNSSEENMFISPENLISLLKDEKVKQINQRTSLYSNISLISSTPKSCIVLDYKLAQL